MPADAATFPLHVAALPEPGGRVVVYDGWDEVRAVSESGGPLDLDLPRGLYTVRAEVGAEVREEVVRLTEPRRVSPHVPVYSSVPLAGAESSHEYYTDPSVELSRRTTRAPLGGGEPTSALFLFVRAARFEAHEEGADLADGLRLRDRRGRWASLLAAEGVERDTRAGWLALSARAPDGPYVLDWAGPPRRRVALRLWPSWQSQVFLTHHGQPLFGSMRVCLGALDPDGTTWGFAPDDPANLALDRALLALQNGAAEPATVFSAETLDALLDGRPASPLLGLVGAHLLLRRPDAEPPEALLVALRAQLPDDPDVRALALLAARRAGRTPPDVGPFAEPPVLRAGAEAVLYAAAERPALVPPGSLLERAAPDLYADTPWTSWRPAPPPPSRKARRKRAARSRRPSTGGAGAVRAEAEIDVGDFLDSARTAARDFVAGLGEGPPTEGAAPPALTWLQTAVLDAVEGDLKREQRRPGAASTAEGADALARRLRVTRPLLRRALRGLDDPRLRDAVAAEWSHVTHLAGGAPLGRALSDRLGVTG